MLFYITNNIWYGISMYEGLATMKTLHIWPDGKSERNRAYISVESCSSAKTGHLSAKKHILA